MLSRSDKRKKEKRLRARMSFERGILSEKNRDALRSGVETTA